MSDTPRMFEEWWEREVVFQGFGGPYDAAKRAWNEREAEIAALRELARASLDAREAEAKAASTFRVATENYSTSTPELEAHIWAIIAASKADAALKAALAAAKEGKT